MTSKAPLPVPVNWTEEPGAATPAAGTGTGTTAGTPAAGTGTTAGWATLFRPDKLNISKV